jgi:hypothetical protein
MRTLGAKREKERCVGEMGKYELECIKEGGWNNECEWVPPHEYCRSSTIKNPPLWKRLPARYWHALILWAEHT